MHTLSLSRLLASLALCVIATGALAHDYALGKIKIGHPWSRATAPGAPAAGGFLKLENGGDADRLISASAAVSETVELHTMAMDGNVMRMRKLDNGVEVPAGKTVELKPGGLHVMFIGLKAPLKEGETFPLKLKFEKAGEVTVDVKIEAMGAAAAPASHAHEHKH